jgi:hypothetical protein
MRFDKHDLILKFGRFSRGQHGVVTTLAIAAASKRYWLMYALHNFAKRADAASVLVRAV